MLVDASVVGTAGLVTVAEACGVWVELGTRDCLVEAGVDIWHAVNNIARTAHPSE